MIEDMLAAVRMLRRVRLRFTRVVEAVRRRKLKRRRPRRGATRSGATPSSARSVSMADGDASVGRGGFGGSVASSAGSGDGATTPGWGVPQLSPTATLRAQLNRDLGAGRAAGTGVGAGAAGWGPDDLAASGDGDAAGAHATLRGAGEAVAEAGDDGGEDADPGKAMDFDSAFAAHRASYDGGSPSANRNGSRRSSSTGPAISDDGVFDVDADADADGDGGMEAKGTDAAAPGSGGGDDGVGGGARTRTPAVDTVAPGAPPQLARGGSDGGGKEAAMASPRAVSLSARRPLALERLSLSDVLMPHHAAAGRTMSSTPSARQATLEALGMAGNGAGGGFGHSSKPRSFSVGGPAGVAPAAHPSLLRSVSSPGPESAAATGAGAGPGAGAIGGANAPAGAGVGSPPNGMRGAPLPPPPPGPRQGGTFANAFWESVQDAGVGSSGSSEGSGE
jgi:hypothetical protein